MALTYSVTKSLGVAKGRGGFRTHVVRVTFDASYAQGGYTLSVSGCGFDTSIITVLAMGGIHNVTGSSATTMYHPSFDQVLGKLQVFTAGSGAAAPTEVAGNFASINGLVCDFLINGY